MSEYINTSTGEKKWIPNGQTLPSGSWTHQPSGQTFQGGSAIGSSAPTSSGSLPNWTVPPSSASSPDFSGTGRMRDHPIDTAIGVAVCIAIAIGLFWLNHAFNENEKPQKRIVQQQYMPPSPPYDPKDPYAASRKQWQDWNAAHPNGKK